MCVCVWLAEMKSYFPQASLTSTFSICPFLVQSWDKKIRGLPILQGRVQEGYPLPFFPLPSWALATRENPNSQLL